MFSFCYVRVRCGVVWMSEKTRDLDPAPRTNNPRSNRPVALRLKLTGKTTSREILDRFGIVFPGGP